MHVDDAFVREVESHIVPEGGRSYIGDIIAATLAVAAERGMVVPADAPRMWATFCGARITQAYRAEDIANHLKVDGETVVRVAIVEIKE